MNVNDLDISEEQEQTIFVNWLEAKNIKFSAIPNSTYTTSWSVKARNKRTGLRPGLPDLIIALPNVGVIFIEMKKKKRGVVSDAQKEWIQVLNSCPGTEAHVCKGADQAIALIETYLTPAPTTRDTADVF